MGCDIHAVIDYEDGRDQPWGFADGEFWFPRDYGLFAALAGVRTGDKKGPLHPPRGLPPRFSTAVVKCFFQHVVEEGENIWPWPKGIDVVSRSKAEEWMQEGLSFFVEGPAGLRGRFVSDPERHTPSWLNLPEIEAALTHAGLRLAEQSPQFRAAVAALKELSRQYGTSKVRLVFWFDG